MGRYLAFDLGASSGRALIGDLRNGQLKLREVARFPNRIVRLRQTLHWNLFGLYARMLDAMCEVARSEKNPPTHLGIDTWGVDFALLARDGQFLGPPVSYRDPRTGGMLESLFQKMPREEIYNRTGIQFLELNTLVQLEAMRRQSSPLLEAADDLLFIPDCFHYLLTGIKRSEFTFATTSQLYNPVLGGWDTEILKRLELSPSLMQPIVMPGTALGQLDPAVAQETGLHDITVTAVATHDTGSAVAAVPADGSDYAYLSSGTWSLMGIESPTPILGEDALATNVTNEGAADGGFRILKNITGLWLLQECRRIWAAEKDYAFDELTKLAEQAPSFGALIDPDHPALHAPDNMPAAIREICRQSRQPAPETPGEIVRCILESLALKARFVLDQLRRLSPQPIRRLHIIGGGTQNRLLCRLTANAIGLPVLAGPVEATAVGNLLVQAKAAGELASFAEIREVSARSFELERYEPTDAASWDAAYDRFLQLNPR